jgi:microcystin-dependent protein
MGGGGTRAVGTVGGAETINLTESQLPAHNHRVSGSTSTNGEHNHGYDDIYFSECCPNNRWLGSGDSDGDNGPKTTPRNTWNAGSHSHTFDVTSASTGGGQAIDKLPPFYVLAYIMRIR